MLEWWNGLSLASQIFAAAAIPATVIMIIQSLLLLFGIGDGMDDTDMDGAGDFDVDHGDGSNEGLSLISVRGIVAFFSIGGWTGIVADSAGLPILLTIIISFAAGLIALIGVALLFKSALKLQGSGNINIVNAIGKTGKAYIPIPPKGKGYGKINIMLQGRFVELEAINEGDLPIATNQTIVVCSVADGQTVIVKSANQPNINQNTQGGISKWNQ